MRARIDLGRKDAKAPDQEPAVQAYRQALQLDPALTEAHLGLAEFLIDWVFFKEGQGSEVAPLAFEHIQRVLQVQPDHSRALTRRGRLSFTTDAGFRMEAALDDLVRASRVDPANEEARLMLGLVCEHTGLLEEAKGYYAASKLKTVYLANPRFRLAVVTWMSMDLQGAKAVYATLPPEQQWELPAVLERMGNPSEAMQTLISVEGLHRPTLDTVGDTGLLAMRAYLLARKGVEGEARTLAARAEKQGRGRAPFHHAAYHLACAYAALGDTVEALRLLRVVAEEGVPCYPLFQKDPRLDTIRSRPVFKLFLEGQRARWEGFKARYAAAQRST